jgi:hypothetical protein
LEDYGRGHEFEGIARHSCKDGAIEEAGAEYDRLGTQVANIVDGVKINGLPKHIARLQHNEGLSDPLRRVPGDAPLKVEHPVEQNLTAMGQANVVEGDASVRAVPDFHEQIALLHERAGLECQLNIGHLHR